MMTLTVEYYFTHPRISSACTPVTLKIIAEHGREFAELVIVEEGMGYTLVNGRPLYIQQGRRILRPAGDVHYYDELGTLGDAANLLI